MSFPATKKTACPNCDEGIQIGEFIEGNLVTHNRQHLECPAPKPRQICPKCFMEMPITGKCDCE